jgi:hypothetical protein
MIGTPKKGDFKQSKDMARGWNSANSAAGTLLGYIPESERPDQKTVARKISEWAEEERAKEALIHGM